MTMPFQYRLAPAWKQRQPLAGNPRHLETMTRLVDETLALQDQDQPAKALERIREAIRIDPMPPGFLTISRPNCSNRSRGPSKPRPPTPGHARP
ncbi:MAG: hypothetical protein Ct9H300mP1_34710 [Planctomycetaceae bacterium]|nr:MAG: hypothetical protein Ct9H300mP1_34710 [Planctomycetaceae bacterium]